GRAHLLLEYHKRLDIASEQRRGASRIGTTGRGIGPAYEDKIARRGIRVADLRADDIAERLRAAAERANEALRASGAEELDPARVAEDVLAYRDRLLPLITDTGHEIARALDSGRRILLEGAQGALLDVDHGTYPFVTSSTTTAAGAATRVGIGPTRCSASSRRTRRAWVADRFPRSWTRSSETGSGSSAASTGRRRGARAAAVGSTPWSSATPHGSTG